MEAVVTARSPLVDHSAAQVGLRERHGRDLLALSRSGERVEQRLRSIKFRASDVLALQGNVQFLPDVLGELRCLPLAARDVPLGRDRRRVVPLAVLGLTIALVSLDLVPLAVGFFATAVALMLLRVLSLREAYEAVQWPIIILLGALVPVSEAVRATGGTELIAVWLAQAAAGLPALGAVAITMLAAMALTPFLNNAATVLVMAPVAASLAAQLGLSPDPFLMAVAVGAACDFLAPIGHQCNPGHGPGGYRFGDYWRLGLPLSIMVLVIGVALIALVWPLRAA